MLTLSVAASKAKKHKVMKKSKGVDFSESEKVQDHEGTYRVFIL